MVVIEKKCIESGMDQYLSKPVSMDQMMLLINKQNSVVKLRKKS